MLNILEIQRLGLTIYFWDFNKISGLCIQSFPAAVKNWMNYSARFSIFICYLRWFYPLNQLSRIFDETNIWNCHFLVFVCTELKPLGNAACRFHVSVAYWQIASTGSVKEIHADNLVIVLIFIIDLIWFVSFIFSAEHFAEWLPTFNSPYLPTYWEFHYFWWSSYTTTFQPTIRKFQLTKLELQRFGMNDSVEYPYNVQPKFLTSMN